MKLTLPKLLKKTEKIFNAWIRERDKDDGCISCGREIDHAGHYFSVGQHSALRFDEMNVNGQCAACNVFKHGNLIYYRQGLVRKYGELAVEELERKAIENPVYKWSREELETIINKCGRP